MRACACARTDWLGYKPNPSSARTTPIRQKPKLVRTRIDQISRIVKRGFFHESFSLFVPRFSTVFRCRTPDRVKRLPARVDSNWKVSANIRAKCEQAKSTYEDSWQCNGDPTALRLS